MRMHTESIFLVLFHCPLTPDIKTGHATHQLILASVCTHACLHMYGMLRNESQEEKDDANTTPASHCIARRKSLAMGQ